MAKKPRELGTTARPDVTFSSERATSNTILGSGRDGDELSWSKEPSSDSGVAEMPKDTDGNNRGRESIGV